MVSFFSYRFINQTDRLPLIKVYTFILTKKKQINIKFNTIITPPFKKRAMLKELDFLLKENKKLIKKVRLLKDINAKYRSENQLDHSKLSQV